MEKKYGEEWYLNNINNNKKALAENLQASPILLITFTNSLPWYKLNFRNKMLTEILPALVELIV